MAEKILQVGLGVLEALISNKKGGSESSEDERYRLLNKRSSKDIGSTFTNHSESVDYVLAWKRSGDTSESREKRKVYQEYLTADGLKLTIQPPMGEYNFVLIHAPREVLERYCEILRIKMPIKNAKRGGTSKVERKPSAWKQYLETFIDVDDESGDHQQKYTAEFSRERRYLFDTESPMFFPSNTKNLIIAYILEQHEYGPDHYARGISRLLEDGAYAAAYPLHDGSYEDKHTMRGDLLKNWASLKKIFTPQPIDKIREYFGTKYALYFAWLGFYTVMLVPAAIVGIICFLYGVITLSSDPISQEICNADAVVMCPLCDRTCDYWQLSTTCTYAKFQYVIDNSATVFFAIFMSFWSTIFLELWKRHRSTLTFQWGLASLDLNIEPPRSKYLSALNKKKTKKRLNRVTKTEEPIVPFWSVRLPNVIISYSFVLLLLFGAVAGVVSTIVYRLSTTATSAALNEPGNESNQGVFTAPVIASVVNFLCIEVLGKIYERAAIYLTELELHRTENEFENSLVLKTYFLQFVNTYAALFYIGLIKGKFVGRPGEYIRVFGYRQEECPPGGCLMELCLQLLVIMTGKQLSNAISENVVPHFTRKSQKKLNLWGDLSPAAGEQYAEDYKLLDLGPRGLYGEYLEIVLQYGFVIIFIACFPIAPVFALLNNLVEIRTDGQKLLKYYRRPVPERVCNIGVWFSILDTLNRLAVLSNSLIIAFTSDFIPRLLYYATTPANGTDFLDFSLSYFNTSDFENISTPLNSTIHPELCRYSDYRNPPGSTNEYTETITFWNLLAGRLAFVVVFQNIVSSVTYALDWAIPDVSSKVLDDLKEEAYVTNEIIVNVERELAKNSIHKATPPADPNERQHAAANHEDE